MEGAHVQHACSFRVQAARNPCTQLMAGMEKAASRRAECEESGGFRNQGMPIDDEQSLLDCNF